MTNQIIGAPATPEIQEWVEGMEPSGWITGMPMATYNEVDAFRSSHLGRLDSETPRTFKWMQDNPTGPSKAMVLGDALDSAILDPERYKERFQLKAKCSELNADGKKCGLVPAFILMNGEQVCTKHSKADDVRAEIDPEAAILSEDNIAAVDGMVASLKAKPKLWSFVERGLHQLSGFFIDPADGLLCKVRPDIMVPDVVIPHLKTTGDLTRDSFMRRMGDMDYHLTIAYYRKVCELGGFTFKWHGFLVCEQTRSNDCAWWPLHENVIDASEDRVKRLMADYAYHKSKGNWPGFPDSLETEALTLKPWDMKELEPVLEIAS